MTSSGLVLSDRKEVYLGDDNSLTLTFNARNEGEGGAYEAELHVVLPPEADYSGIARNNEVSKTANRLKNLQLPPGSYVSWDSYLSVFPNYCPVLCLTHSSLRFSRA